MNRWIHQHMLLPGFETFIKKRSTFKYLKELEGTQWCSMSRLEQLQLDRLKRLLMHAYSTCKYYQRTWHDHELDPGSVRTLSDFSCWPVITREDIRLNREEMRSQLPNLRCYSKATGGSSGEPLQFDLNYDSHDRRVAASYRGYSWAGAGLGTKQWYLWGTNIGEQTTARRWKERLYSALHRRMMLSAFELSDETVPEFLSRLNAYRPDAVVAYTNPLYEFARLLEERDLRPFSPRSIVVGAEKLHPFQREQIERVFKAPVFETYGSREFMLMGAECDRHEGLHLTSEQLLLEVVNDDGTPARDGEEGSVVVTDLYNYGMPFIRYANGDRAIAGWKTCSCGRGLPMLTRVSGRSLDILRSPDGRRIPGELFPHLLKDFQSVRRFQVVQDKVDHVTVRIVAQPELLAEDRAAIGRVLAAVLGSSLRLDVVSVSGIPLTRAGKLRVVVNECVHQERSSHCTQFESLRR